MVKRLKGADGHYEGNDLSAFLSLIVQGGCRKELLMNHTKYGMES